MGTFERYLSLWVAAAIVAGVVSGQLVPDFYRAIAGLEYAHVNLIIALLIWAMIFPMMVQVDFTSIRELKYKRRGLALTLVINWLVKPFTMFALGWLFFRVFFAGWVNEADANQYIAGMILLGAAPCTAMVFVWSQLTKGDANYTLMQVAVNDLIMIFAFAPIVGLLLGLTNLSVPWGTLLLSVLLYVVLPLIAGILTRRHLLQRGGITRVEHLIHAAKPWSICGLLATVVILFGLQAQTILAQPLVIVLIAIPLILQTYGIFGIAWIAARQLKLPHQIAAPACLIGTSNFFELAVAVAISVFGISSGAALATVVGVLVEVPVMLSLVAFANRRRDAKEEIASSLRSSQ